MTLRSSPELIRLYETYTAHPDSIGFKMAAAATAAAVNDPLIVATNADLVLFPGGGRDPEVEGFRFSTLGFKELAAVSHLGPALASLMHIRAHGSNGDFWRNEASRLLEATSAARAANSIGLWRDVIAGAAYRGREARLAAMSGYA